jgi:hypothetical protein
MMMSAARAGVRGGARAGVRCGAAGGVWMQTRRVAGQRRAAVNPGAIQGDVAARVEGFW